MHKIFIVFSGETALLLIRRRAKKLEESLNKLNKYSHVLNSKKHQRNGTTANERSGGSNLSKMASQNHRNSSELLTQGLEDRSKNVVLNKRVRSSMAELRVCMKDFVFKSL